MVPLFTRSFLACSHLSIVIYAATVSRLSLRMYTAGVICGAGLALKYQGVIKYQNFLFTAFYEFRLGKAVA